MKTLRLLLCILFTGCAMAQIVPGPATTGPQSSIVGQLQTATGGIVKAGTLNFTLSQPAIAAGTASVVSQGSACYTSNAGNIVGLPDPQPLPTVSANTVGGSLSAGTYYVQIFYYNAANLVSGVSPEKVVTLSVTGSLIISAPVFQPSVAVGYGVAISSTSGAESIQGLVTGWGQFTQTVALTTGNPPQTANNSTCNVWFSDALIPTGTYYSVSLFNKNGSLISGFPQTWCTYGGTSGTIDVSQGAPTGNCNTKGVFYPTPIMASPAGSSQSISGNLSLGGNFTAGGSITAGSVVSSSVNFSIYATPGESVAHAVARLPVGGGKVIFATGTYPSGGVVISTPNVWLEGAGMPNYNSATAPTALTGGTIFQGPISATQGGDHFVIRNAGVDTGPTWVTNSNGGVATDALSIANNGQVVGAPQVQAPIIENVSCLGFSLSAAFHCMLVENVTNAYVHNVQTVYNQHGLVLKGTFSTVDGVYARGHSIDAVIVKSDNYASSAVDTLTNIRIYPLASPGDTKGMILQATGATMNDIQVSNVDINQALGFGIQVQGAAVGTPATNFHFSNVMINYQSASPTNHYCFQFVQYVTVVHMDNILCENYWAGINFNLPVAGFTNDFSLSNSHFINNANVGVETYGRWEITNSGFIADGTGISADTNSVANVANNQFASNTADMGGAGSYAFAEGTLPLAAASLPTCNAAMEGRRQPVNNANSATFNAAVAGGGANHVLAYCNGTGWVIH